MSRLNKHLREHITEVREGIEARRNWGRVKEIYDQETEPGVLTIESWPKAVLGKAIRFFEPSQRKWRRETLESWRYSAEQAIKASSAAGRYFSMKAVEECEAQFLARENMTIQEFLKGGQNVDK